MRICLGAILVLCLCAFAANTKTLSAEDLMALSETQAADKQFDAALKSLKKAAKLDPENVDIKIQIARVHSWQGKYEQAAKELAKLAKDNPDNADIQVADANIDYYQGHNDVAAEKFAVIVAVHPDNVEAMDGLKLAKDAQKDAEGFVWALDTGYEHSSFARQSQTPWQNEFLQLTRQFDGGATAVHARFEYYDEFETSNTYFEIGADHRFTPWANVYLYAGHTFDATFHPRWRVEPGGNLRVLEADDNQPSVWLTVDMKEDDYGSIDVASVNPGLRIEAGDWALSPNLVMVKQWGLPSIFGWNVRLDGPVIDGLRFYVGYADAPETEDAVTVYTASMYGGFSYDIDDARTVSIGYTHDDRQNSWIRHVANIAFTNRF